MTKKKIPTSTTTITLNKFRSWHHKSGRNIFWRLSISIFWNRTHVDSHRMNKDDDVFSSAMRTKSSRESPNWILFTLKNVIDTSNRPYKSWEWFKITITFWDFSTVSLRTLRPLPVKVDWLVSEQQCCCQPQDATEIIEQSKVSSNVHIVWIISQLLFLTINYKYRPAFLVTAK